MVEMAKAGFWEFVQTLPEPVIKKTIWDKYFSVKAESGNVPSMRGSSYILGTLCLLEQYGLIYEKYELIRQCEFFLYHIFVYAPLDALKDRIKEQFEKKDTELEFWDYAKAAGCLKTKYNKWFAELEFYKGKEDFDYEKAEELYKNERQALFYGYERVQEEIKKRGFALDVLSIAERIKPEIEQVFRQQNESTKKDYEGYNGWEEQKLYEGYASLIQIPCRTAYTDKVMQDMERLLAERKRKIVEKLLSQFQSAVADKQVQSGRIFYGNNEDKVRQVESEFVSTGKFEYVLFGNDTSVRLNGKEGLVFTNENLYYKGSFYGGEIPIAQISHFEFSGKMFKQGLVVYTLKGKKYNVPCKIGDTQQLRYLRVLDELVRVLQRRRIDQKEEEGAEE